MFYYRQKSDTKEKGVIDLVGTSIKFPDGQNKDPFCFEIHTKTRVWYLQALSEEDLNSWVDAILQSNDYLASHS